MTLALPFGAAETPLPGLVLLRGFADPSVLQPAIEAVTAAAPFRHMATPGGRRMSVAMTNCGEAGWVTDRAGYRYQPTDPESGRAWPPMPAAFRDLAAAAAARAGFPGFAPDVCLINRYVPGARLGAHRDEDEASYDHPIVSVSLGLPATFLFHGERRGGRALRLPLADGDVVVFGGPARLGYHGVAPLADGSDPRFGACRINLTLRRAL